MYHVKKRSRPVPLSLLLLLRCLVILVPTSPSTSHFPLPPACQPPFRAIPPSSSPAPTASLSSALATREPPLALLSISRPSQPDTLSSSPSPLLLARPSLTSFTGPARNSIRRLHATGFAAVNRPLCARLQKVYTCPLTLVVLEGCSFLVGTPKHTAHSVPRRETCSINRGHLAVPIYVASTQPSKRTADKPSQSACQGPEMAFLSRAGLGLRGTAGSNSRRITVSLIIPAH
ncbi:hypothetical protein B0J12DRAFT_60911 [Macrophomina phaseolina]|uniref:Uncharacterized protein n=1 Tax=Macrophomina phaseolina TaxID=35725 RepID=A0ABQ8GCD8_9PEZI|nr:hypothetical protein B0J12DRAFT_60911 [Macrophomina phaseolina]